ncbi:DUF423 domain-containing protein [Stenotrophomonas sp. PS02298]|jgi:uncharacterized membrane protein YgdD (TMEM256/DUF423 family)|uniref:DUF423 domain-containing protein n=1 Tax=Stenotrophomonas sp. PS02298 TaxID=2991424 RepID=UPI000DB2381F|nr:DUF423 domain-containing protein [Stenotrophomonas sp. PS02298]PZU29527.1 MAG: DUF423 domain-containing protein [Stenotrophomonas sp.]
MLGVERRARKPSFLAFCGGLLAAAAVGLSAYASHGVSEALAQSHLNTAALYAFGHGVVLVGLGASSVNQLGRGALYVLLLGTLLFSGSLVGNVLMHWPTTLAPAGGITLMGGWVLLALSALRR